MLDKNIVTQDGYDEVVNELYKRKTVTRKEIADDIERARQQGDLSENASYKVAIENKEYNETKIVALEEILKNMVIQKKVSGNTVQIGSNVKIQDQSTKQMREFTIVGENEADPALNKISFKSPLGQILIGQQLDSLVIFKTPVNEIKYIIVAIE